MNPDAVHETLERFESRIVEQGGRCTITRGTHPDVTTVASGVPCWVRPSLRATREVEAGGATIILHLYDVKVPLETAAEKGDVLTVTESRDAHLQGRFLTVREVVTREWRASRVLVCQESR